MTKIPAISKITQRTNKMTINNTGEKPFFSIFVQPKNTHGSLTLAHSQNSQMSFMYGFFFVKFLFFTVVCVVIVI